jgi:DNA-binding transcriptional LysR family regulator
MDFTSRQLRAFVLVAQHQNFARAADALFITPSGLSALIRELERQLGFRLFDRTTRQVALTPQGTQLLSVTRRNLDELDAVMSQAGQVVRDASLTLSVGAGLLLAANVLPPAIKEFRRQHPEVQIQLVDADPVTLQQRVASGTLDLAVGYFPSGPGIRRTPFFRFSLLVVRPADETLPPRATTTWTALKGERRLTQVPIGSVQQLIDRHLARAGVTAPPAMILNRLDTVLAMVAAGEGIAVVPSFVLPACQHRRVVMSRLINPTVTLDFHQIRSRGRTLPPAADAFAAFLQSSIARWAGRSGVL